MERVNQLTFYHTHEYFYRPIIRVTSQSLLKTINYSHLQMGEEKVATRLTEKEEREMSKINK